MLNLPSHSVVTTVRSQAKADKIKEAYPKLDKSQLDFAIVEYIAQPNAFDEAIKSDPPFEAVIHTASPFHFNAKDIQKVRSRRWRYVMALHYVCIDRM